MTFDLYSFLCVSDCSFVSSSLQLKSLYMRLVADMQSVPTMRIFISFCHTYTRPSVLSLPSVFDSCRVTVDGNTYVVRDGDVVVDPAVCQRCECDDGELEDCETLDASDCTSIAPLGDGQDCMYQGRTIEHGDFIEVCVIGGGRAH